jgi:hypothetical protein
MNKNLILMWASVGLLISSITNIIVCLIERSYSLATLTVLPSSVFVFLIQFNYKKWKESRVK